MDPHKLQCKLTCSKFHKKFDKISQKVDLCLCLHRKPLGWQSKRKGLPVVLSFTVDLFCCIFCLFLCTPCATVCLAKLPSHINPLEQSLHLNRISSGNRLKWKTKINILLNGFTCHRSFPFCCYRPQVKVVFSRASVCPLGGVGVGYLCSHIVSGGRYPWRQDPTGVVPCPFRRVGCSWYQIPSGG